MSKDNFDRIQKIRDLLGELEEGLKILQDKVDTSTQKTLNEALPYTQLLRDKLHIIDKSLEDGKGV